MTKFPVGFWNYQNSDNVWTNQPEEWAELGMTIPMAPNYIPGVSDKTHFYSILDKAHINGMKIILRDTRTEAHLLASLGREAFIDGVKAALADFGNHPAVWGIHIGDEPGKAQYDSFCEACRIVKELAPDLQPFANLLPWFNGVGSVVGFDDFGEYLDSFVKDSGVSFLCYDCYAQMNPGDSGWDMYYRNLYYYSESARRNNIPFWTTLLSIGHFRYRTPNIDDFRWQINTAAAHGAKGILWFFIYQHTVGYSNYRNGPVNEHGRKTQSYWDISDNQRTFNNFFGDKLMDLSLVKVQHMGKSYGGYPLFAGDDVCVKEDGDEYPPMILSYFKDADNRNYVMLTNNSCIESIHFTLKIKGENSKIFMFRYGGAEDEISGAQHDNGMMERKNGYVTLPHWFHPGQAILFRYE